MLKKVNDTNPPIVPATIFRTRSLRSPQPAWYPPRTILRSALSMRNGTVRKRSRPSACGPLSTNIDAPVACDEAWRRRIDRGSGDRPHQIQRDQQRADSRQDEYGSDDQHQTTTVTILRIQKNPIR